jgi:hypothetical protein
MNNMFKLRTNIVAVVLLIMGVLTAISFGSMTALAQTMMQSNHTTSGKAMTGNATTGNATGSVKGNSTSMPTPVGPPGP